MRITESQLRRVVRKIINEQGMYGLTSGAAATSAPTDLPNFKASGYIGAIDITGFVDALEGEINWDNTQKIFAHFSQGPSMGTLYVRPSGKVYLAYGRRGDLSFLFHAVLEGLCNSGATNIPCAARKPGTYVATMAPMASTLKGNPEKMMPVVYGS